MLQCTKEKWWIQIIFEEKRYIRIKRVGCVKCVAYYLKASLKLLGEAKSISYLYNVEILKNKHINVMMNLQNTEFKTLEQLKSLAPSIFAKHGSNGTSLKYSHIPTDRVIRDMEVLGWGVVDVKEVKARKNVGYQKHLIIFRNNDIVINGKNDDVIYPQILLTNSHDGKNAFSFMAGLFRVICENGLVVSDETFGDIKIRHMGYNFEELEGTIKKMVEFLPLTIETMNKMVEIELEQDQILSLAKDLLEVRVENTNNTFSLSSIEEILNPQRKEDEGDNLWKVFNRIQENIIEGNFSYSTSKGKSRSARKIKNFQQDLHLNRKMFSKALEYVN
jgi:hypothetical protein